jgi:hypothetical protein
MKTVFVSVLALCAMGLVGCAKKPSKPEPQPSLHGEVRSVYWGEGSHVSPIFVFQWD